MRCAVALCALLIVASSSLGQIIYQPVQYQYGTENQKFYYGGTNPYVLQKGAYYGLKPIDREPLRVYSDLLPDYNAAIFGFTPDDARNDAYNAVPRHFRKSDLLKAAVRVDGMTIVPARAPVTPRGTVEIKPYVPPARKTLSPVIVIPKSLLDKPLPGAQPAAPKA